MGNCCAATESVGSEQLMNREISILPKTPQSTNRKEEDATGINFTKDVVNIAIYKKNSLKQSINAEQISNEYKFKEKEIEEFQEKLKENAIEEKEIKRKIEYIRDETSFKPLTEPMGIEINENNHEIIKKLEDRFNKPKKNNFGSRFQISNKILNRVQNLEKHFNGEGVNNETENKVFVDEYMNIILDKPVLNKNKKFTKMKFSEV